MLTVDLPKQWSTICCAAGAVWSSTIASVLGLLYCTASLHSWVGPRCRPSWPQPAPVCRWYAGVRQHFGQGCWATAAAVGRFPACLVDIEDWPKASWLRLNPTKTQVMWLGSPSSWPKSTS